ncbi:hypothetical protein NDU88_009186 [Pleurodeles waltl]|uniref:Uncharacterized protein n=1 Tax=Pleurodeles waltl TaxID=8319 RepID=A0AAV7RXT8_PLEWA|nr:hypothetical protein NDU88_009171 [Pleurodeles waltl]KAJ1156467.1 hypothetical protein NDU88_009186 [Pleurodeles waltl]
MLPRVAARAFSTRAPWEGSPRPLGLMGRASQQGPLAPLDLAELLLIAAVVCTVRPALSSAPTSSVLPWCTGCLLRSDDLLRHPAGCLQRELDTSSDPRSGCLSVSTTVCSDAGNRVVFVLDRARGRAPLHH